MKAQEFVEKLLIEKLKVTEICMGSNAFFGHNREGNAAQMQQWAERYGFQFEEIRPIEIHGESVSSSRLRKLITAGNLEEARLCLGRDFSVLGKVVPGENRGKTLGFPTANLKIDSHVFPPLGVYPTRVRVVDLNFEQSRPGDGGNKMILSTHSGPWIEGVLNYGVRPTFGGSKKEAHTALMEIHLLNYHGDLYGKRLEVALYPKIRDEAKFQNTAALKEQIDSDIQKVRAIFSARPNNSFTRTND